MERTGQAFHTPDQRSPRAHRLPDGAGCRSVSGRDEQRAGAPLCAAPGRAFAAGQCAPRRNGRARAATCARVWRGPRAGGRCRRRIAPWPSLLLLGMATGGCCLARNRTLQVIAELRAEKVVFARIGRRVIEADFDGGRLGSHRPAPSPTCAAQEDRRDNVRCRTDRHPGLTYFQVRCRLGDFRFEARERHIAIDAARRQNHPCRRRSEA